MTKKVIAVLVLLMLVSGAAFGGWFGVIGWGAFVGGGAGAAYGLIAGIEDDSSIYYAAGVAGGGLILILLDLLFSDSGSVAQAPSKNPALEHVSFGVAPNSAYIGVNFKF